MTEKMPSLKGVLNLNDDQLASSSTPSNRTVCQRRYALGPLIHRSNRGMRYLSIRCAERLAEARSDMSAESVGNSYDYALAETGIGLFKTEVVKHLGLWKTAGQLGWETTKRVHWYD